MFSHTASPDTINDEPETKMNNNRNTKEHIVDMKINNTINKYLHFVNQCILILQSF